MVDRVRLHENCGTVRCEPGWSWLPQSRQLVDFDLWYVWAGRGEMRSADGVVALRPGTLLCLRPGMDYSASHDPTNRLGVSYLHFNFDRTPQQREPLPASCEAGETEWTEQILRHAVHLRQSPDPLGHEQAARLVEAVLLAMRAVQATPAVSPRERQHREAVAAVVRHVRENPGELFAVTDLAARTGYSVDHFSRLFQAHVGRTPKAFCIAVRTERAGQLLRESAMSVEDVAGELGYADVFFFSRQFKQQTGLSPTEWRNRRSVDIAAGTHAGLGARGLGST